MYDQYPRTAEEIHLVYRGFDFQFSYYRRCQMMRPSICPHVVSAWHVMSDLRASSWNIDLDRRQKTARSIMNHSSSNLYSGSTVKIR
ncbi:hypothetical protein Pmani_026712 [Petrolisthes manimaculis]|uniref:Uncharacterized protein n=1 Tax=Petrolisthes manimaculis TaxID=1843537 RepID=A0AAE1TZU9_9EUCA|nr:hypothetical protein Pmani_026712 [Petrolisthes manimaculis]